MNCRGVCSEVLQDQRPEGFHQLAACSEVALGKQYRGIAEAVCCSPWLAKNLVAEDHVEGMGLSAWEVNESGVP